VKDPFFNNDIVLLAKAVDAAGSSLIITDHRLHEHPIIFCNPAFERLTGYRKDEIIGRNCRFLQAEDRSQQNIRAIRMAIDAAQACSVPIRNYRKDGSAFWNELFLSPVLDEYGRLTHFIGLQYDISGRMAGKEADRDFKNYASHEINTPLTTIKGTLQLLQRNGLDVDARFVQRSLEAALRAVQRLEKFRKELLN
jgi:two-component system phosphate regulon sensor histidine kinase PhoR